MCFVIDRVPAHVDCLGRFHWNFMLCVGLTVGRIGKFLVVIQSAMRIPDQFSLPRHCRIEQFRKFNSISHTVTSRFLHCGSDPADNQTQFNLEICIWIANHFRLRCTWCRQRFALCECCVVVFVFTIITLTVQYSTVQYSLVQLVQWSSW